MCWVRLTRWGGTHTRAGHVPYLGRDKVPLHRCSGWKTFFYTIWPSFLSFSMSKPLGSSLKSSFVIDKCKKQSRIVAWIRCESPLQGSLIISLLNLNLDMYISCLAILWTRITHAMVLDAYNSLRLECICVHLPFVGYEYNGLVIPSYMWNTIVYWWQKLDSHKFYGNFMCD